MNVCSLLSLFWVRGWGEEPQCQLLIFGLVTTSQMQGGGDSSIPPPPQALLAAGEGVRGLSRNGKVAQHCPVFRLLLHSLDPLPVPGFLGTFQATISAHLCVLGSWLCPPPAHWESPLPT